MGTHLEFYVPNYFAYTATCNNDVYKSLMKRRFAKDKFT